MWSLEKKDSTYNFHRKYKNIWKNTTGDCKIEKIERQGEQKWSQGRQKWAKGHQKLAKREPKGTKREPKGARREPKGAQREPKGSQRAPKGRPKWAKGWPKCIKKSTLGKGTEKCAPRAIRQTIPRTILGAILKPFSIQARKNNAKRAQGEPKVRKRSS